MAVERKRGCGFRRVGGLYLVGEGLAEDCDRLPVSLSVCPACGQGIKFSRGWTWIEPDQLLNGDHYIDHKLCLDHKCPICRPHYLKPRAGLLWVGEKFYTLGTFLQEAKEMGVSKRIHCVPRDFILGETWVLLAHIKGAIVPDPNNDVFPVEVPAIFYAFKPQRIEKIVPESQTKDEKEMARLKKRGITPVAVPDHDNDHAA